MDGCCQPLVSKLDTLDTMIILCNWFDTSKYMNRLYISLPTFLIQSISR